MNLRDYEKNTMFLDTQGFIWCITNRHEDKASIMITLRLIPNVECVYKSKRYLEQIPFPSQALKSNCTYWGWDRTFDLDGKNRAHHTILEKEISKEEFPEYFL